jgi:hypothetical protein
MSIRIRVQDDQAKALIKNLKKALSPEETDPVIQGISFRTLSRLVRDTPKGFTGQTRKNWEVTKLGGRKGYAVHNDNKVMLYLEVGTKAHGPKTAKFLYIPLKAGAMIWRPNLKFGRDYVLAKRVKGIKAKRIVERERPRTRDDSLTAMKAHLRKSL